jgi:hypothetical protein
VVHPEGNDGKLSWKSCTETMLEELGTIQKVVGMDGLESIEIRCGKTSKEATAISKIYE